MAGVEVEVGAGAFCKGPLAAGAGVVAGARFGFGAFVAEAKRPLTGGTDPGGS